MKGKTITLFAAVALFAALGVAQAGTGYVQMQCYGNFSTTSTDVADRGGLDSVTTPLIHLGPSVDTANGESFQCWVIIPYDYDNEGADPTLAFWGFVPPNQVCGITGCTLPNDIDWTIWWEDYADTTPLAPTWKQGGTTNTEYADGDVTCLGTSHCWEPEDALRFVGDVPETDAGDFTAGNLLVIRVERNTELGNYGGVFKVLNGAVTLAYPN